MLRSFPYPDLPVHVSPSLTLLLGDMSPVKLAHEHCHVILASMRKPCLGGVTWQAEVHITRPQQENGTPADRRSCPVFRQQKRDSLHCSLHSLLARLPGTAVRGAHAGFALAWRQEPLHQPVEQHGCCLGFMSSVQLS